jgi:hypothetical protein
MILACAVLAAIKIGKGSWALYLIAPVIAAGFFAFMALPKTADPLKKLMRVVFSAHIAVIITITQAVFVFEIKTGNAAAILAIAAVFIAFMVWALRRMFKKLSEFENKEEKEM